MSWPSGTEWRTRLSRGKAKKLQEPAMVMRQAASGPAGCVGLDLGPEHPPQYACRGKGQADDHTFEQVEEHHAQQGHGVDQQVTGAQAGPDVRHLDQPRPDHHQQSGEHGQRNQLDQSGEEGRESQDPDAVQHGRGAGPGAGLDVGGAADDHARYGQAAQRSGNHVGRALAHEFPVEVGAGPVLHLVDGDGGQQGLDAGDQGHGEHGKRDGAPVAVRQSRQRHGVEN